MWREILSIRFKINSARNTDINLQFKTLVPAKSRTRARIIYRIQSEVFLANMFPAMTFKLAPASKLSDFYHSTISATIEQASKKEAI
jgi:hypothetical protein